MLSARKAVVVALLGAAFLVLQGTFGQKQNSPTVQDRQREQHSLAVNIVRAINTAEANYRKKHGAYATWDTLMANGDFTDSGTKWAPESLPTVSHAMYGSGPEIVPGWKLRLTLSKDGTAYDLLLEDVNDPKCRFAVGSDDRGLIRQSKAVDCPV